MNDQRSFIDIIDTITNNYKLLHTISGIWGTNDIHYEIKEEYHNVNYENPHEATNCTATRSFIEEDGSIGIIYTSITKTSTYSSCKEIDCNVPYPDKEHYKYSVWDVYEHYEEYLPEVYKILGWGEDENLGKEEYYSIFGNNDTENDWYCILINCELCLLEYKYEMINFIKKYLSPDDLTFVKVINDIQFDGISRFNELFVEYAKGIINDDIVYLATSWYDKIIKPNKQYSIQWCI